MAARRTVRILAAGAAVLASGAFAGIALASTSAPSSHPTGKSHSSLQVRVLVNGKNLQHAFVPAGSTTSMTEPLADPDDITMLGGRLFTAFQNGVGPQGQASSDGNTFSTIVEYTTSGKVIKQWDIKGKCDGLTADPGRGYLIATVNEDANSSVYTITPKGRHAGIVHYAYNKALPHFGGTDAISIYHGLVLISASAPGTTGTAAPQPSYPAVYVVTFNKHTLIATIHPLFFDEASAKLANKGSTEGTTVTLMLTDPDSNEVVPNSAARFAGDFMLTSQGDQEQIFLSRHRHGGLSVLKLANSVDDTAWAQGRGGTLYGSDTSGDTIDVVTGHFPRGAVIVAVTPCDANDAPATCPGPGFPANYLGYLNPWTGAITAVTLSGPEFNPQGLIFVQGLGHTRGHGRR